MMNTEKRNFDKEAALWDEQPARGKLAKDIARTISKEIVLTPETDMMDFGCGTGLLSLQLRPFVRTVTGIDSSQGMLDIFDRKIARLNLGNVKTALVNLDKGGRLSGNYDLVVSSMTLHHIKEPEPLFDQFHAVTAPGGWLGIADLDLENGRFHGDSTGVFHFGFDRTELGRVFTKAGFENVRFADAAEVVKPSASGEMGRFTVFLMIGQKRGEQTKL